jgi:hypothetical protein
MVRVSSHGHSASAHRANSSSSSMPASSSWLPTSLRSGPVHCRSPAEWELMYVAATGRHTAR